MAAVRPPSGLCRRNIVYSMEVGAARVRAATVRRKLDTVHRIPSTRRLLNSRAHSYRPGFMSPPVAPPGWSRWLVPPAALSVHLSIGQAYAWSVFKPPLESALGLSGTQSALPFQLGIVMLGLSAAFGGTLVERNGPRWAMTVALVCFSSGFLLSALGASLEQYWLIVLGYGFVGGIGLGIGYISPVSTLIKWFPDRPGMATGIAIMGFGGGALIASPWSAQMLESFGSRQRRHRAGVPGARPVVRRLHAAGCAPGPGAEQCPRGAGNCATGPLARSAGLREPGHAHPAVLVPVARALHERHRRHRHPGEGRPDDHGLLRGHLHTGVGDGRRRLRRPAVGGQHGGPHRLVVDVRPDRPQEHLPRLPGRRRADVRRSSPCSATPPSRCSSCARWSSSPSTAAASRRSPRI